MYYVYILYSLKADRYYIGETSNIELRLQQHNEGVFSGSYTKISNDWTIKRIIECENIIIARKIEKHIKSKKRRAYTEMVISEDLLCKSLIEEYSK